MKPKFGLVVVLAIVAMSITFFATYFLLTLGINYLAVSESKPGENLPVVIIMLAGVVATIVAFSLKGVGKVESIGEVAGTASFVGVVASSGLSSGNILITLVGVIGFALAAVCLVTDDPATKDLEKFFSKGKLVGYFGAEFVLVLAPIIWLALKVSRPI